MGTERTRLTMIEKCKHDWPVQSGNCPECRKEWENAQSSCSSPSACSVSCEKCGDADILKRYIAPKPVYAGSCFVRNSPEYMAYRCQSCGYTWRGPTKTQNGKIVFATWVSLTVMLSVALVLFGRDLTGTDAGFCFFGGSLAGMWVGYELGTHNAGTNVPSEAR